MNQPALHTGERALRSPPLATRTPRMSRYVLQRIAGMLAVMFVVVTVVFVIVRIAPGDPASVMLGA